uniref:Uncharacterized protein n=1 Tax=Amphora coffeiformis TaxID=265554 RepID=A0A7S3LFH0_9STRA|mmetsp:Transcript_24963/g.47408  ORF Transcript_24963/g.47408 Transcript_24963/m.47408 type:complete len:799 (-) Transcript_24963:83-2479(-)
MAAPTVECTSSKMKLPLTFTWIVFVLISNVEALSPLRPFQSVENAPRLPAFYQQGVTSRRPRSTTTELPMGLRNILGKVRKKKDRDNERDDDDDYSEPTPSAKQRNPSSVSPETSKTLSQLSPPAASRAGGTGKESTEPRLPVRMGMGKDGVFDVNLLDDNESVQERINRVKAGKMTVEEKLAFLNAALSTGNTPETRLPLRPPTAEAPPMDPAEQKKSRASPFPEDPILRSIAGGKDPGPAKLSQQIIDNAGIDSQKKKREYLDMVTDPHRFDVLRTQPANARLNPMAPTQGRIADAQQQYDFRAPVPPQQPAPAPPAMESPYLPMKQAPVQQNDNYPYTAPPPVPTTPKTTPPTQPVYNDTVSLDSSSSDNPDLAYRLGAAAIAQEQQRIAQEQQREEQRKKEEEEKKRKALELEEQNRAAAAKAAEEEQRRQEILAQREKEYRDRRRKEEEAAAREAAKLKEKEEQRLKTLMDAQQSYWEKKLARERELRENRLNEEQQQKRTAPTPPTAASVPVVTSPPSPPRPSPSQGGQNLSKHVFNPDERNILDEKLSSATDNRKRNESIPTPIPTPSFLNDVANSGLSRPQPKAKGPPLVRGKKQEEMDEQLRRLKELNSPLPNIPQGRYAEKKRNVPPASFQPQRPVSAYSSSPKPSSGSVNGVGTSPPARISSQAPSSPPPAPAPTPVPAPAPVRAPAPSNPLNSLFGNQPAPVPAPRAVAPRPAPASPPERKGPIRMQLPIDDDDGDAYDDEEGIDSRSNKNMSIADVKRKTGANQNSSEDPDERSKKWGVDMSKFM